MVTRSAFARIGVLFPFHAFLFAGAQVSGQDQPASCLGSSIPFQTSTLERITAEADAVLEEGRAFWEAEKPLILVQGWADEVGSPNPYERFRVAVQELAAHPAGEREGHPLLRIADEIIAQQERWQAAAIPHLCSFFPTEVDLSRPAYFVAFIPPRAFATSEGIVIDVSAEYWEGASDHVLNMMIHEFFHVGYGQLRSRRTEIPLENARLNSIAESIQNEGMAVWVAYEARRAFPAPGEVDNRLLGNPDDVASLRAALNGLFERSSSISDDQFRRQSWRIGVTNRAYYVVGAHMARVIQAERGKEALLETLAKGPLSYIRLFNALVPEEERLKFPGS
jgi:hypothetical protein